MNWKDSQKGFPWGTVLLFAIGIAMGSALLKTQAAPWLAKLIVTHLGLATASAFAIFMLLSLFLGVASAWLLPVFALTGAAGAMALLALIAGRTDNELSPVASQAK